MPPPAVCAGLAQRRGIDLVFGLAGQAVLLRQADPVLQDARRRPQQCTALAQAHRTRPPASSRLYAAFASAAASWAQPWRGILKAAVMAAGDPPRLVVPSLVAPTPQRLSAALYGARGHGEHDSQAVQWALHSDRTAATTCLANAMRLLLSWAASVLPQALRTQTLPPTA